MKTVPHAVVDRAGWRDVQHVDNHGENLTQWEIDFVESLTQQLLAGGRLSKKQRERLEEIAEEKTA